MKIEYLVKSHTKESRKEMFRKRFFINYSEGEKSAQPPLQHIEIIKEKVGVHRNLDLIKKGLRRGVDYGIYPSVHIGI